MIKRMFGFIKAILFVVWLAAIAVLGAWIATDNPQPLALSLFVVTLPELSVGVYLCIVLGVGVMLGFFTCFIGMQISILMKNRALKKAQKEVSQLKQHASEQSGGMATHKSN